MKKNDISQLRNKKLTELIKLVSDKKKEVLVTTYRKAGKSTEKDVKKVRNIKLEVARILTLIREREIIEKEDIHQDK